MVGKTEVVKNNLNPNWSTCFEYYFIFEAHQYLQIRVIDVDDGKNDDILGSADVELVTIITKGVNGGYELDLKVNGTPNKGKVRIRFERIATENNIFTIGTQASDLRTGCCSMNDVFLKFYRPQDAHLNAANGAQVPAGCWIMIHQTEHYKGNLNPRFQTFDVTGARLCKNNT